jgi:NADP-dependent 3-hydroxy acid dehydrogenase YdfG
MRRVAVLSRHLASAEDDETGAFAAVITGAGSGIGRATAELLACSGYNVICADLNKACYEQ